MDNLQKIKHLLEYESTDDYYYLQVIARKKDNPDLPVNSRIIKVYYIRSLQGLESRYDEIKTICEAFNARACLHLQKRSFKKTSMEAMKIMIENGINQSWEYSNRAFTKAAGRNHNDKSKKWIVDLDDFPSGMLINSVMQYITECNPAGEKKHLLTMPTKTGVHLITKPFNSTQFNEKFPDIDIHKNNPVNLYIPDR